MTQKINPRERADRYAYRVLWSEEDQEHVGLCAEFRLLSWLDKDPQKALAGIRKVVAQEIADRIEDGLTVPEPIASRKFSGVFKARVPPETHRRLVLEAHEAGISLNRLVSEKLAQ